MMKELKSSNVLLKNRVNMRKTLEVFQSVKQFSGTTYLYSKHKAVDASNLTKLVSFMLTVKPQTTVKIIGDGAGADQHIEHLKQVMSKDTSVLRMTDKSLSNSSGSLQI